MVMIPFHPLLKDASEEIRKAGRRISPTNVLKLSGLGEKITVGDLTPPDQPNTYTIAIFKKCCRNTCNLEYQGITDAHAKSLIQKYGKVISVLTEAL